MGNAIIKDKKHLSALIIQSKSESKCIASNKSQASQIETLALQVYDNYLNAIDKVQKINKQIGSDIHPGLVGAQFSSRQDKPGIEVTEIEPGSPAAQRGLKEGDLIIAVNRLKVENIQQLERIAKKNSILYLMFERDNRTLILRIQ